MQLQSDEGRINIEVVKHVRLFIIVWCKDNVVHNVFQCLEDHLAMDKVEETMSAYSLSLAINIFFDRRCLPYFVIVFCNIEVRAMM